MKKLRKATRGNNVYTLSVTTGDDKKAGTDANITVEIEDVTAVHGNRNPSFEDSQRDFRMAFVIMHPSSEEMDFDDYLVIEDTREELSRLWEGMVEDRATMNGQLGGSANYELAPAAFPPGLAFEPELDDSGEAGAGCQTSLAAGAGGASGLLLLLPLLVRARRRAQRA